MLTEYHEYQLAIKLLIDLPTASYDAYCQYLQNTTIRICSKQMVRKITHKSARDKGKNFERSIAKLLNNNHIDAKRVPMSGALSWLKGDVREYNTVQSHVHECKFQETLCVPDWWRQALDQIQDDEVPVLHFTSSYKPTISVMRLDDFDDMVAAYQHYHPGYLFTVHEIPARKNFWQWQHKHPISVTGFYQLQLEGEPVIAMNIRQYLMLRRAHVKRLAESLIG